MMMLAINYDISNTISKFMVHKISCFDQHARFPHNFNGYHPHLIQSLLRMDWWANKKCIFPLTIKHIVWNYI